MVPFLFEFLTWLSFSKLKEKTLFQPPATIKTVVPTRATTRLENAHFVSAYMRIRVYGGMLSLLALLFPTTALTSPFFSLHFCQSTSRNTYLHRWTYHANNFWKTPPLNSNYYIFVLNRTFCFPRTSGTFWNVLYRLLHIHKLPLSEFIALTHFEYQILM